MLDSLLTLTKGAAAWMAGGLIVCVLMDRAVSALTGNPVSVFALFALGILLALLVAGAYTAAKWLWHRTHTGT
jgi:hypothetical protein